MKKEEIDKLLAEENNEALEAHNEIIAIQKDKSNVLKTGYDWLDDSLVGGLNNKLLFEGSRPGNGKTYKCSELINNLLNLEINPMLVNILRLNLEVPTLTLYVRELAKALNKKPSEIFETPFTEEEKPIVTKVYTAFKDPRVKNFSKTLKGQDFRYLIEKFIADVDKKDEERNDGIKTKKVVLLDHLNIYPDKQTIDEILLICNDLKLQDKNLTLIFFFQLLRTVEDLWREGKDKKINPKNVLPNSTFIYQSDVLHQVADLVVGMVIPQIYDMELFASVHKERDKHLAEHFAEDDKDSSWARLKGRNRIYYNIMKNRMMDDFDDPKLFCDILSLANEEKANKLMKENTSPFTSIPTFSSTQFHTTIPVFEKDPTALPPNFKPISFEDSKDNDKSPF